MPLRLLNADVLETPASALLITIDGQARDLRGNIAHAFIRRWPEAYEDFDSHLEFPIPLGSVVRVDEDTGCPWRTLIFLSTLHHIETLSTGDKVGVISRALGYALNLSAAAGLASLSTAVLKGGWRLPLKDAYAAMVETYDRSAFRRQGRVLNVCSLDRSEFKALQEFGQPGSGG